MFYKNCYIIQSLKQSLKIKHYYLSLVMKTGGAKSLSCFPKDITQKGLVTKLCSCVDLRQKVLPPPPELGVDVTCSKRLLSAFPIFLSITACSLLLSVVTFLSVKLHMCADAYIHKNANMWSSCCSIQLHPVQY